MAEPLIFGRGGDRRAVLGGHDRGKDGEVPAFRPEAIRLVAAGIALGEAFSELAAGKVIAVERSAIADDQGIGVRPGKRYRLRRIECKRRPCRLIATAGYQCQY